jgi:hypothetical protein
MTEDRIFAAHLAGRFARARLAGLGRNALRVAMEDSIAHVADPQERMAAMLRAADAILEAKEARGR